MIAERILDSRVAVTVRLVHRRRKRGSTRLKRAVVHSVGIWNVHMDRGRHRLPLAVGLPDLDDRIANPNLGVMNDPFR
jgi:hypothetical protein